MTKDFNDGVCNSCGNTGLAGEKCIVCGEMMSKIEDGINDPVTSGDDDFPVSNEPEVYPLEAVDKEESGEDFQDIIND